jgi:hypothetical protein
MARGVGLGFGAAFGLIHSAGFAEADFEDVEITSDFVRVTGALVKLSPEDVLFEEPGTIAELDRGCWLFLRPVRVGRDCPGAKVLNDLGLDTPLNDLGLVSADIEGLLGFRALSMDDERLLPLGCDRSFERLGLREAGSLDRDRPR